jgi:hypothetical protein
MDSLPFLKGQGHNAFAGKVRGMMGANAGKTLDAPTSPFARFRSKMQPGPRPGLPSVIGNLFQGAASPDAGSTIPGALSGLMGGAGVAGAGPMQAAPEGPGMLSGLMGGAPEPQNGGLAGLMQRLKARTAAPMAPPPAPGMPPMLPTNGGY